MEKVATESILDNNNNTRDLLEVTMGRRSTT